jgi:uncharacterized Zn-binding protein involved in type VI secretion
MSTLTLVQPRVWSREWELRRGDEVRARLRLSTFLPSAEAEADRRPLSIEYRRWWRSELLVRDGHTDEEVAQLRRNELRLGGKTLTWKRLGRKGGAGFVDGSGEPLVAVRIKRGVLRVSGEVTMAATLPEQDALVLALLAVYLILRRSAAAVVGSTADNQPPHIPTPPGTTFQKPPANKGTIQVGSATVRITGKSAARNGDVVMTCNDPADLPVGQVVAVGMVSAG